MKFIHTADWQIGKPFAGIRDPSKQALVQQARIEVIARIGAAARDADAEVIVVAGDLFDSPSADRRTVSAACGAIGQLDRPVYVIPGNHDHGGPGSTWTQEYFQRECAALSPNLTVLLESVPHDCGSAVLLPCPLLRRTAASDPTEWLRAPAVLQGLPVDRPRILLAHGSTQSFGADWQDEEEVWAPGNLLDLARLPEADIDYIALGDWHGTKQVSAKAWYAGTPELDRFPKGGDHDPGNVLLVEARRGEAPAVTRISTGKLGWRELAFDFPDDAAFAALQQRLDALLGRRVNQDLLKLTLTGPIGIETAAALERALEALEARLLRLQLDDQTTIIPSNAEIDALARRTADPLTARVATTLIELAKQPVGGDETARIAGIALRELYAVCQSVEKEP